MASAFLAWLGLLPGLRGFDVGCGTGALCAAISERCSPESLTGIEPSEDLLKVAREALAGRVHLHLASAPAIPMANATVDVMVCGLVLNFVPDLSAAFKEVARVAAPGATFGAYVRDYAEKMELIRHFWDAALALDPDAAKMDEAVRFPLCRPDVLLAQVGGRGFRDVEVAAISIARPFASFQEYWDPFLGG